jgi:hypothetical protein
MGKQVKTVHVPTEQSLTTELCAPLVATLPLEVRRKIEEFLKGVFAVFQGNYSWSPTRLHFLLGLPS